MHRTGLGAVVLLLACGGPTIPALSENVLFQFYPSLAISPSGQLAIAYATRGEGNEGIVTRVSVFDGAGWSNLGDAIPLQNGTLDRGPQIAFQPDGTLLLKTQEPFSDVGAVFVRRWTGTAWELMGGPDGPLGAGQECFGARMALDSAGAPVIAASIPHAPGSAPTISLRRWDGATWAPFASDDVAQADALTLLFDFAIDSTQRPILLIAPRAASSPAARIVRWEGGAWQELPQAPRPRAADLAQDSSGALLTVDPSSEELSLMRFDGASWTSSSPAQGSEGTLLREPDASLALDGSGGVLVAWHEAANVQIFGSAPPLRIYVQRWTGEAWERVLGPLDSGRGWPTSGVQIATGGSFTAEPVVAWMEFDPSTRGAFGDSLFVRVPR